MYNFYNVDQDFYVYTSLRKILVYENINWIKHFLHIYTYICIYIYSNSEKKKIKSAMGSNWDLYSFIQEKNFSVLDVQNLSLP